MSVRQNDHIVNNFYEYNQQGIPVRDRLTDIFAYYPSNELMWTGKAEYIDRVGDVIEAPDPNDAAMAMLKRMNADMAYEEKGHNSRKTKKESTKDRFEKQMLYAEILDSMALIELNRFRERISMPWTTMEMMHLQNMERHHHIKLIKRKPKKTDKVQLSKEEKRQKRMKKKLNKMGIETLEGVHPLTSYQKYLERIKSNTIDIPDRYALSYAEPYIGGARGAYYPVKITAIIQKRLKTSDAIDLLPIHLFDMQYPRSPTMLCMHMSEPLNRNGISATDHITFGLYYALANDHIRRYLSEYCVSSIGTYRITDEQEAMLMHMTYALLRDDLQRMIFYTPRQAIEFFRLLVSDEIKEYLYEVTEITEEQLLEFEAYVDENGNADEDDKSANDKSANNRGQKFKNPLVLERLSEIMDVLYALSQAKKKSVITECLKQLWPELSIIGFECGHYDRTYADYLKQYLDQHMIYCSPIYAVAEAIVGYDIGQSEGSNGSYLLDPSKAYFEFIEINDNYFNKHKSALKVKSFRRLQIGSLYELVITSYLTDSIRSMTNEIVRVYGYDNSVPIVKPICRESDIIYSRCDDMSSNGGADADVSRIITLDQIEDVFVESKLNVIDYCFRKVKTSYKFYIELDPNCYEHKSNDSNVIDVVKDVKNSHIKYRLLKLLVIGRDEYDRRDVVNVSRNIEDVETRIVSPGTFRELIEMRTIDALDSAMCRINKRIVDEHEIEKLKSNIAYQF